MLKPIHVLGTSKQRVNAEPHLGPSNPQRARHLFTDGICGPQNEGPGWEEMLCRKIPSAAAAPGPLNFENSARTTRGQLRNFVSQNLAVGRGQLKCLRISIQSIEMLPCKERNAVLNQERCEDAITELKSAIGEVYRSLGTSIDERLCACHHCRPGNKKEHGLG